MRDSTRGLTGDLKRSEAGVEWLVVPAWEKLPWLWHGVSTRRNGVSRAYLPKGVADDVPGELNLGFTAHDARALVLENRRLLVEAVTNGKDGRSLPRLVTVKQIHSNCSSVLRTIREFENAAPEGDGLLTDVPGVLLGIQTADCIPVLAVDPNKRAVAAFHAGWRGTVERIVELGIERMRTEFGSNPRDLVAAIGPGIGACCYTVGGEVRRRFADGFAYAAELFSDEREDAEGKLVYRLDLIEANRRQLLDAGLSAEAISVVGGCTNCHPELFFSHRGSGGYAGRMMAVIGVSAQEAHGIRHSD